MGGKKIITILAGIVILGSVLVIALSMSSGFGPSLDAAPIREAGRVLARQALAQLKPGGSVLVITRDTAFFENPASDVLLESFRRELRKNRVEVAAIQTIQIDPLRPVAVPAGDFLQWIKKTEKGSVIVSFMGPPILSDAQLAQLGQAKPAIIALCSGPARDQVDLRGIFAQGLLQGAVVSKRTPANMPARAASDREAFEQRFAEVTSGNLAPLAPGTAANPQYP